MEQTILVFSDSHGNAELMRRALAANPNADVIHLGDGIDDLVFLDTADRRVYSVWGNFEAWQYPTAPKRGDTLERILELAGLRILMMHGHTRAVKGGLDAAILAARRADADLLLFGHTHTPVDIYLPGTEAQKPLRVFNPGSVGRGMPQSYGVLTVRNGVLLTSHFKK